VNALHFVHAQVLVAQRLCARGRPRVGPRGGTSPSAITRRGRPTPTTRRPAPRSATSCAGSAPRAYLLIAERYERKSIALTENQPFSEWNQVFPEPAMTTPSPAPDIRATAASALPATLAYPDSAAPRCASSGRQLHRSSAPLADLVHSCRNALPWVSTSGRFV
jgi:hypothetical protein